MCKLKLHFLKKIPRFDLMDFFVTSYIIDLSYFIEQVLETGQV